MPSPADHEPTTIINISPELIRENNRRRWIDLCRANPDWGFTEANNWGEDEDEEADPQEAECDEDPIN